MHPPLKFKWPMLSLTRPAAGGWPRRHKGVLSKTCARPPTHRPYRNLLVFPQLRLVPDQGITCKCQFDSATLTVGRIARGTVRRASLDSERLRSRLCFRSKQGMDAKPEDAMLMGLYEPSASGG